MFASKMLLSTLKDVPQEAKIPSHILLLRAGMIKNEVSGVFNYLPLGLRVIRKIENIIREEMDHSGALEILCSAIQPKELWVESGRWQKYGPELIRFSDRHDREFCLGPTHEEIFTSLVRDLVKSSKSLPLNIYQIQTKYRDEVRPRFGLMRSREFIMKDAYSFDKDEEGLDKSYQNMYDTYTRIFNRFKLNFKVVLADTGAIGGNSSHQFMALSEVGESDIVYCDDCGYAADVEKAEAKVDFYNGGELKEIEEVYTPEKRTIEEVANYLNIEPKQMVKTIIYYDNNSKEFVAVLVRGDRDINEIKVINYLDSTENNLRLATNEEIESLDSVHGFCGPINLNIKILVDEEVANLNNCVIGANKESYHLKNVAYGRDFKGLVSCFRKAEAGDLCPICGKPLKKERGIEVGQIFKLQTKYSLAMNCTYTNEKNENVPMVMGCYGIGVSRTLASIIEQYHDDYGIIWPLNVAPYHVVIVPVNSKDEAQTKLANEMYDKLTKAGVEVILDDRDAKVGFKFKDWELIGIPYIVTCGRDAINGMVEFKRRNDVSNKYLLSKEQVIEEIIKAVEEI